MHGNTFAHWAVTIIAIVGVTYTALYFSKVEAVDYSRSIGTVTVVQFVPNGGNSTEFVTLDFSALGGRVALADFDGWSLKSERGLDYDLSQVVLTNEGSIRICEEAAADESCDFYWEGNDMFGDVSGGLHITARDGTTVVHIPYGDDDLVRAGSVLTGSGNYLADVYSANDKITVCTAQPDGSARLQNSGVQKLIQAIGKVTPAETDVIPPFIYEVNATKNTKTMDYHPGANWPEGKEFWAGGCR